LSSCLGNLSPKQLKDIFFSQDFLHLNSTRPADKASFLALASCRSFFLQSVDRFQIKRLDYCLCRLCSVSQNPVDRNSANSGFSVPAGLTAYFGHFFPKQLNNIFSGQDFLHLGTARLVYGSDLTHRSSFSPDRLRLHVRREMLARGFPMNPRSGNSQLSPSLSQTGASLVTALSGD
jgi:hypothetical protein